MNGNMHVADNSTIVVAQAADVPFVEHLARRYTNAVGFIARQGLEAYADRRGILVSLENDDPAGYLLAGARVATAPHIRPIYQAAVAMDAQRRHHGLALVDRLAANALLDGQQLLQCWCRQDLEANEFWAAAGFVAVATRISENARRHPCILWRRAVTAVKAGDVTAVALPRKLAGPGGAWLTNGSHAAPTYLMHTTAAAPIVPPTAAALRAVRAERHPRLNVPAVLRRPASNAAGRTAAAAYGRGPR